jgi:hypothetical protein
MFVLAMECSGSGADPATPRVTTDFGGHGGGVTPVPIPNTEVKPSRADGTWQETAWESRTPPDFSLKRAVHSGGPLRVFGHLGK